MIENRFKIENIKIRYVLNIISFHKKVPRLAKESPFDYQNSKINLAYITQNDKILKPKIEIKTNNYFSYGFAAIYTSSYNQKFSECSIDIFKDRFSENMFYDKGLIIEVENNQEDFNFLFIDRKVNNSYILNFLHKELETYPDIIKNILNIKQEKITFFENEINFLLKTLKNDIVKKIKLDFIIATTNKFEFSFLGFLLFEIIDLLR